MDRFSFLISRSGIGHRVCLFGELPDSMTDSLPLEVPVSSV